MFGWSEGDVEEVQERTGMDRLQAIRHVEQRNYLRDRLRRGTLSDRRFNKEKEQQE